MPLATASSQGSMLPCSGARRRRPAPDFCSLIRRAMELHSRSLGAFDPGVCALVRLWRFDREENLAVASGPPADEEIQALRARQGTLEDVTVSGTTVRARRPLCIDLGGMAKGSALERARRLLADQGIANALIDIGGSSLLALGQPDAPPPGRAWRVGLRDPRSAGVIGALDLKSGESVDTSGDYERAFSVGGERFHHILDPRTGQPASGVASVTVVTRDAELGDAASTALLAGGDARFRELTAALGITDAFLVTTRGELVTTGPMRERLLRSNGGQLPGSVGPAPGASSPTGRICVTRSRPGHTACV